MSSASYQRSVKRTTIDNMAPAPPPISLRLGHDGTDALADLARRRGITKAEAARQAIEETAERERRRSGLAEEARGLAADPRYVEEAREIIEMMEEMSDPR
jgi:predicted transcriptional regulator